MLDIINSTLNFIILLTAVLHLGEIVPQDLPSGHLLVGDAAVSHPLHVQGGEVSCTRL